MFLAPFPEKETLDRLTQGPIIQVLTVPYRIAFVGLLATTVCSGTLHPSVSVSDSVSMDME